MKTKVIYICTFLFAVLILIISCNETSLNDFSSQQISYISHKSNGCVSENKLMKTNDEAILSFEYSGAKLKTYASFYANCGAFFKDSISINKNTINIFLSDTSKMAANCNCPYKEEFNFEIGNVKEINVLFCLNNYVIADTLLKLY
jgi:hypothetical protein